MNFSESNPKRATDVGITTPPAETVRESKDESGDSQELPDAGDAENRFMSGWRLHLTTLSLLVLLFLVQMESSIASTTLLSITDQFGGYEKSSWVFTAYMLTYCGFQMIWAKWSDITGRRFALLMCLVIFTISSALCGASQSLMQLIHFRWTQGIGACGIFAMAQVSLFELYPPHQWPMYMSIFTAVIALAAVTGPLLGGAITEGGIWRWIFLLNVPVCIVILPTIYFVFPRSRTLATSRRERLTHMVSPLSLRKVDVIGSITLLGASVLLSTGLQQAEIGLSWTSPAVLSLILCSIPLIVVFLLWEWHVTMRREYPEPIFPWRFFKNRIQIGMIINTFLVGAVLFVCTVQIPQRYITVHGLSPLSAATKLLSFGVLVAGGSSVAAALMGRFRIAPCWVIMFGAILQVVGLVFLARMDDSAQIDTSQYAFQVMAGLGVGIINAALTLLVPYVMDKKDLATGTASISQFRMLGGLIGLSIAVSVSTPHIRAQLLEILPPSDVEHLLEKTQTIELMDTSSVTGVRQIFSMGYSLQIKILVGFAVAQVASTLLMWTNRVAEPKKIES